ncbi:hypothetical protein [Streptomyces sp. NPDC090080]|uniref:hypothetical protein n=1 Tax=Streptomyces sp. NPDC090080 TaxID=3365939 RepID=UPI00380E1CF3
MTIGATAVMTPGQSVQAGRVTLQFTKVGDLRLVDSADRIVWSSHTGGSGSKAVFQGDGNLAVYTADQTTAWSSRTDGHAGAVLVIKKSGDMSIVFKGTTLWHTDTAL